MPLKPDEFKMISGKQHPLYKGVLREAHEKGLLSLEVAILQYPSEENRWTAVCQATATFPGPNGRELIFTEIGDADDANVNPMIRPHKIRMSATRAKGRALRDALGIGEALVEEITGNGNSEDDLGAERARPAMERSTQSRPAANRPASGQSAPVRPPEPVASDDPDAAIARVVAEKYPPVGEAICAGKDCGSVLTLEELRDCAREKLSKPCCGEHLIAYLKKQADKASQSS